MQPCEDCVYSTVRDRHSGSTSETWVDTDVVGRILRDWMPAIHAGMTVFLAMNQVS